MSRTFTNRSLQSGMERGGGEQDGGGVQQRDRESARTTVADRTQRCLSLLL